MRARALSVQRHPTVSRAAALTQVAQVLDLRPPQTGGRIVLVRRLNLGVLRLGGSLVAQRAALERWLEEQARAAPRGDSPGAAQAEIVWFEDWVQAYAALTLTRARRQPDPWWAKRLGELGAEEPATCLAVIEALERSGALEELLLSWSPADGVTTLRALLGAEDYVALQHYARLPRADAPAPPPRLPAETRGGPRRGEPVAPEDEPLAEAPLEALPSRSPDRRLQAEPPNDPHAGRAVAPEDALPTPWLDRLTTHAARWGGLDPRSLALAVLAVVVPRPERLLWEGLPGRVVATLRRALDPPETQRGSPTAQRRAEAARDGARGQGAEEQGRAAPPSPPLQGPAPLNDLLSVYGPPTDAGGVVLLVNLLRRVGLERELRHATEPEGLGAAVVALTLLEAELPETDPTWALLPGWAAPTPPDPRWPGRAWVDLDPAPGRPWLESAAAWCADQLKQDLRWLVRRPGRLRLTRTHAEVSQKPEQAEITLRRLNLDQDPGWVPWLERVLLLRYVEGPNGV